MKTRKFSRGSAIAAALFFLAPALADVSAFQGAWIIEHEDYDLMVEITRANQDSFGVEFYHRAKASGKQIFNCRVMGEVRGETLYLGDAVCNDAGTGEQNTIVTSPNEVFTLNSVLELKNGVMTETLQDCKDNDPPNCTSIYRPVEP
ncbi:MAG: hypothetical protein IJ523_03100 [Succinivibrionaceae bacterium]|nr:hypothetical protein [Succinivibrionaceae bacterium]